MNTELVAIALVLLLSVAPLWGLRGRWRHFAVAWAGLVAVACGGWAFVLHSHGSGERLAEAQAEAANTRPVAVAGDGFVTSTSCRACHPQEYATWHASYHRTMTQVASPKSVVGDFDSVSLSLHGRDYRLREHRGKYFVEVQEPVDGQKQRTEYEIVLTTGSHHMQFYWYSLGDGRELGKLPFVFLFSEQRWVPADATFLRPPSRTGSLDLGQWNQNCINCHTTHGKSGIRFASEEMTRDNIEAIETSVAEFGIACEACHGPAENHVALNRDPLRRYKLHLGDGGDDSIVQPLTQPATLSSHVCGQCHSVSLPKTVALSRQVMEGGWDYVAGDDLLAQDSDRVVVGRHAQAESLDLAKQRDPGYMGTLFWPDGMVRVAGREFNGLLETPCFTHQDTQRGVMGCMSCHELHPQDGDVELKDWADDQLKPGMRTDEACLQCHEEFRDPARHADHTHHDLTSSGSRCYNCHMPHTTYGLLKGIRSHTVSTPSVSESVFVGRPNACNLCHLDQTLAWTGEHLKAWYGLETPSLDHDQQTVAASILWTLKGDAGQRALLAWHLGWEPATQVSGTDWLAPFLGLLMSDSYDAIRYIAYDALKKLPLFEGHVFDFVSERDRGRVTQQVIQEWARAASQDPVGGRADRLRLLLEAPGKLDQRRWRQLLGRRDERPILLNE